MQVVRSASIPRNQVRLALVSLRFGLATGSWLVPRWTSRLFGLQPDINPVSPYLARLSGARAACWCSGGVAGNRASAGRVGPGQTRVDPPAHGDRRGGPRGDAAGA